MMRTGVQRTTAVIVFVVAASACSIGEDRVCDPIPRLRVTATPGARAVAPGVEIELIAYELTGTCGPELIIAP